jgi:aspartyl-tRNA(Asn)/glutamyl-tRNA(Gln) amidotransferase subunit A
MSAATMASGLANGTFTSAGLIADSLARIRRANEEIGAFVYIDEEGAARAADEADRRRAQGRQLGPLDGVPVAVKDNLWVAGMPAHWGSRMWSDFIPPADDISVERLRRAGAVIVGKTNTPEFALSGRTDSPLHGPARNPWDSRLTPGGSSGGSVAAVAAGMVPLTLATDAGGSTRLPAGYTGLYGLRPSNGRIARRYGFPPMAIDFQAVGVVARDMDDLELLLNIVAGPDPRDPSSCRVPDLPVPDRPIKVGWCAAIGDEGVDPEVAAAVAECAALLKDAGCEVTGREVPYDLALVRRVWSALSAAGAARAAEMHPGRWRNEASAAIKAAAERGLKLTAVDYVHALDDLSKVRNGVADAWGEMDILVCPSAASPAWPLEQEFPAMVGKRPGHAMAQNIFATWVNAVGYPGLSIPARPHADGRPLGVQIVGRFGGEQIMFKAARLIEQAATWTRPEFPWR